MSSPALFGNVVPDGYGYQKKQITHTEPLRLPTAWLKWYDIFPASDPVTPDQRDEARAFVSAEAASDRVDLEHDLGFVILHRAGSVLLLLLTTWRRTNEMFESVYVKRVDAAAGYAPVPQESNHKATYCVWELGAVWHERNAWVQFLSSPRDDSAKLAYVEDCFSGMI
jgi:hypothetical protein